MDLFDCMDHVMVDFKLAMYEGCILYMYVCKLVNPGLPNEKT